MEEVVGSIPTRSTKSLNGLAPIAILIPKFLPVISYLCCLFLPVFTAPSATRTVPAPLAWPGPERGVDILGQSGVGVAQDALSRLRVHLFLHHRHGSER